MWNGTCMMPIETVKHQSHSIFIKKKFVFNCMSRDMWFRYRFVSDEYMAVFSSLSNSYLVYG